MQHAQAQAHIEFIWFTSAWVHRRIYSMLQFKRTSSSSGLPRRGFTDEFGNAYIYMWFTSAWVLPRDLITLQLKRTSNSVGSSAWAYRRVREQRWHLHNSWFTSPWVHRRMWKFTLVQARIEFRGITSPWVFRRIQKQTRACKSAWFTSAWVYRRSCNKLKLKCTSSSHGLPRRGFTDEFGR